MTHLPNLWRQKASFSKKASEAEKMFSKQRARRNRKKSEELSNVVTFYFNCIRLSLYTSTSHDFSQPKDTFPAMCFHLKITLPLIKSGVYSENWGLRVFLQIQTERIPLFHPNNRRWISTYQQKKKFWFDIAVAFVSFQSSSLQIWMGICFLMMKTKLKKLFWPTFLSKLNQFLTRNNSAVKYLMTTERWEVTRACVWEKERADTVGKPKL